MKILSELLGNVNRYGNTWSGVFRLQKVHNS